MIAAPMTCCSGFSGSCQKTTGELALYGIIGADIGALEILDSCPSHESFHPRRGDEWFGLTYISMDFD